jgi:hypothetical protein
MNASGNIPSNTSTFRKRFRKVVTDVKWREFEERRKSSISRKRG